MAHSIPQNVALLAKGDHVSDFDAVMKPAMGYWRSRSWGYGCESTDESRHCVRHL
jgi:hypothetical protein